VSKKVNPSLIGAFMFGALAILTMTFVVLLRGNLFRSSVPFVLYFNSSINGLDVGSAVKFKGVRIGTVKSIDIIYDAEVNAVSTPTVIEINGNVFSPSIESLPKSEQSEFYKHQIINGLSAKLSMESLVTGKLFIELDYYHPYKMRFYGKNGTHFQQIPTVASEIEKFISGADNILKKFNEIDFKTISDQSISILSEVDHQVKNLDLAAMTRHISEAAISIQRFLNSDRINNLLESLRMVMVNVQKFLDQLSQTLVHFEGNVATVVSTIQQIGSRLGHSCDAFSTVCVHISGLVGAQSDFRENVKAFLSQGTRALQSLRYFFDLLNKTPNAIFAGVDYENKEN
jgi:paraquat-inducible protein B